jgi:hypothetical protein
MSQKPVQTVQKVRGASDPTADQESPSQKLAPAPSRPNLVDYFLLLIGFALSVYLTRVGPLPIQAKDFVADPRLRQIVPYLSDLMRLPEGVVLLWPFFLTLQRILGRKQGLTSIEWLWVLSWLGVAVLSGLTAWQNSIGFADWLLPYLSLVPRLWYVILVPSMAALAVVLRVMSLFSRQPAPWTHSFGLALLVWPVLPLVGILTAANFMV